MSTFYSINNNAQPVPRKICHKILNAILDVGQRRRKLASHAFTNANAGKLGSESLQGKHNAEIYMSLNSFFDKLKEARVPFVTWFIRGETVTTMQDDNPDDVALPPHFSKRCHYENWCLQIGWKVACISQSKGICVYVKEL